ATITDVKDIEPEIKQVLQYNSENRENTQRFRTYDPSGIAPTLNTMQGGGLEPHIPETKIAASRGRGKNNEQQLEVNKDDTSNALTTVEKDNYVVELIAKEKFGRMGEQAVRTQNKLRLPHGETLNPWNE